MLNSSLVKYKDVTVTTTQNNLSPFNGHTSLEFNDGIILSVFSKGGANYPCIYSIDENTLHIYSRNVGTFIIRIVYK